MLGRREAQKEGYDEVVLLNERGEAAKHPANIFAVKNRKFTRRHKLRLPRSVTRGILFEIAPEAGIAVVEQTLRPEDLYSADEVFISSTNRNIIALAKSPPQNRRRARPITRQIEDSSSPTSPTTSRAA